MCKRSLEGCIIQYPLRAMKNYFNSYPGKVMLILCMGVLLRREGAAQCVNNLGTRAYDTALTGIGYGYYTIRVPQWSPDSGQLVSVKVSVLVSVQYGYTLKNVDVNPSIYTLSVGREDYISSPAMLHPYDNDMEQKIGVVPLAAGASMTQGLFPFMNDYVNSDSITDNVTPFLGTDSISFTYSPITWSDLHTNNNSSYAYHATVQDAMKFSVSYLYCKSGIILATDLTRFTAVLSAPATVQLSWSSAAEADGRRYAVQRSQDGQHFTTVGTLSATGSAGALQGNRGVGDYRYTDYLPAAVGDNWYYRLRIDDPGGLRYSEVRVVTRGDGTDRVRLYPNPAADFINVVTGSGMGGQIEILGADGSLVQRSVYWQSGVIRVDFQRRLSAGTYFVRIADLSGQHRPIASFIVADAR
jgi:hypothetical protein